MTKSRDKHPAVRLFHYTLQSIPIYLMYGLFACLPVTTASAFGGFIARSIGPLWGVSRRAEKNLEYIFPDLAPPLRRKIIRQMWDNLGRTAAEAPHLKQLALQKTTTVSGEQHLRAAKESGRPVIFLTAHTGNWELAAAFSALRLDTELSVIYRKPNNPFADKLVRHIRRFSAHTLLMKGADGWRGLLRALRNGRSVGLLTDQKMTGGLTVDFLGKPALTAQAPATLALKTGAVLLPAYVIRKEDMCFCIAIEEPLTVHRDLSPEDQIRDLTQQMNDRLGAHIGQYPGQWLWLHRRWGRV